MKEETDGRGREHLAGGHSAGQEGPEPGPWVSPDFRNLPPLHPTAAAGLLRLGKPLVQSKGRSFIWNCKTHNSSLGVRQRTPGFDWRIPEIEMVLGDNRCPE